MEKSAVDTAAVQYQHFRRLFIAPNCSDDWALFLQAPCSSPEMKERLFHEMEIFIRTKNGQAWPMREEMLIGIISQIGLNVVSAYLLCCLSLGFKFVHLGGVWKQTAQNSRPSSLNPVVCASPCLFFFYQPPLRASTGRQQKPATRSIFPPHQMTPKAPPLENWSGTGH